MDFIKDENNIVIFKGEDFSLTKEGLSCKDFQAPWCKSDKFTKFSTDSYPSDYRGRHYTYDGVWVKTQIGLNYDNSTFITIKIKRQKNNKAACKAYIYSLYPLETQLNGLAGALDPTFTETMNAHILALREAENDCFDSMEAATTMDELSAITNPIWEEVTYVA